MGVGALPAGWTELCFAPKVGTRHLSWALVLSKGTVQESWMPLARSWGSGSPHSWHMKLEGCHLLVKLPGAESDSRRRIHFEHIS